MLAPSSDRRPSPAIGARRPRRPTQGGASARNTYSTYTPEYPATCNELERSLSTRSWSFSEACEARKAWKAAADPGLGLPSVPFSRWRAHRAGGSRRSVCRSRGGRARRAGQLALPVSFRALRGGGQIPFVRGAARGTRPTRAATEATRWARLPRESWRGSSTSQHECPIPSARADARVGIEVCVCRRSFAVHSRAPPCTASRASADFSRLGCLASHGSCRFELSPMAARKLLSRASRPLPLNRPFDPCSSPHGWCFRRCSPCIHTTMEPKTTRAHWHRNVCAEF